MRYFRDTLNKLRLFDEHCSSACRIEPQDGWRFKIAAFFAHSGDSWIWCGFLFILWLFSPGERERILAFWGGSIALTAVFVFLLKRLIARARPAGDWGGVYRKTDPYSFPSGHAVRAGLIVMLAFYTFHEPLILFLICLWSVLMIFSRVAAGVHYFLDIIAGYLLGLLIGRVWILLAPWIFRQFAFLFDKSSWFM